MGGNSCCYYDGSGLYQDHFEYYQKPHDHLIRQLELLDTFTRWL